MRHVLKYPTIWLIRFLQYKYRTISARHSIKDVRDTNNTLILLQNILYFFKVEFSAWGYFHPDCSWSLKDEKEFNKLFPKKTYVERERVIEYNPEAVTYYQNIIFDRSKKIPNHAKAIREQLIKWKRWN